MVDAIDVIPGPCQNGFGYSDATFNSPFHSERHLDSDASDLCRSREGGACHQRLLHVSCDPGSAACTVRRLASFARRTIEKICDQVSRGQAATRYRLIQTTLERCARGRQLPEERPDLATLSLYSIVTGVLSIVVQALEFGDPAPFYCAAFWRGRRRGRRRRGGGGGGAAARQRANASRAVAAPATNAPRTTPNGFVMVLRLRFGVLHEIVH